MSVSTLCGIGLGLADSYYSQLYWLAKVEKLGGLRELGLKSVKLSDYFVALPEYRLSVPGVVLFVHEEAKAPLLQGLI